MRNCENFVFLREKIADFAMLAELSTSEVILAIIATNYCIKRIRGWLGWLEWKWHLLWENIDDYIDPDISDYYEDDWNDEDE